MGQRGNLKENQEMFWTEKHEKTTCKLHDADKAILRGRFIGLNVLLKRGKVTNQ